MWPLVDWPVDCSWCRTACCISHSDTDCLRCVCACAPSDCVWHRMHVDISCTRVADGRYASSCASEDWSGAGKPGHRSHTLRVFPQCALSRAREVHQSCQRCADIGCSDGDSCAHVQPARDHRTLMRLHIRYMGPDAASINSHHSHNNWQLSSDTAIPLPCTLLYYLAQHETVHNTAKKQCQ